MIKISNFCPLMKKHKIKPKRTVIFALWTGEEMGLIGSRYWTKNPTLGISMDKVVTNFKRTTEYSTYSNNSKEVIVV